MLMLAYSCQVVDRPLGRRSAGASGKLAAMAVLVAMIGGASCASHPASTGQGGSLALPHTDVSESLHPKSAPTVGVENASATRESGSNDSSPSYRNENRAKLDELLSRREKDVVSDFPIGPGDILEVSVPAMDQLKAVEVRVLENGTVMLPLLGSVQVGGLTEEQAGDALRQRLRQYMYRPQFSIFVKRYQSRQVSVMGALDRPGVYTLANPRETIISMIGKAGGLNDKAGSRVFLIPGAFDAKPPISALALNGSPGSVDGTRDSADSSTIVRDLPQRASAISGDLSVAPTQTFAAGAGNTGDSLSIDVGRASDRKYLQIPARPGDVIIVTQAGQVAVEGWVQTPGAFNIGPGMTVLGAVAAAGGALFSSKVRILRTGDDGEQITKRANLRNIRNREEPDIPVQAGDVVIVDKSALGAGPYLVYTLFSKFNTGMYMPVP